MDPQPKTVEPEFLQPAPSLDDLADVALCERCQRDLTHLPRAGRFCPHCGSPRPTADSLPAIPYARALPALPTDSAQTIRQLDQYRPLAAQVMSQTPDAVSHGPILLGYASALYRLGWRYESARGATRNLDEALRCYSKASRLSRSEEPETDERALSDR